MAPAVRATKPGAGPLGLARTLALSCHPFPALAVTAFAVALLAAAGNAADRCMVGAVAVLGGQLSIGWSNDRIDAGRDRYNARTDKPLARDDAPVRAVDAAIAVAVLCAVGFSFVLGVMAAVLHLFAVACGWTYNAWLKRTWWSWLPYAMAFGSLPAIATLARPDHAAPAVWAPAAGALLGFTAHLVNTLPDLEGDLATGVRGFPHRIGERATLRGALVVAVVATTIVALAPRWPPPADVWPLSGLAVVLAVTGAVLGTQRSRRRLPFVLVVAVAAIDVILVVSSGRALVG